MKIFCATDLTVKTGQLKLGFTTDLKFYSSSQNKEWIASNILFLTDLKDLRYTVRYCIGYSVVQISRFTLEDGPTSVTGTFQKDPGYDDEDGQVVWTNRSSQNRLLVVQIIRCENVSDKMLDEQVV